MTKPVSPINEELQSRLDFIGLDAAARARLAQSQPHITKHLGPALSAFYDKLAAVPAVASFFSGRPQMDRAKGKQASHWQAIASGQFDDAYLQASTKVGLVHARIGLEPRWHIGGYGLVLETLVRGVVKDLMAEALAPQTGRFGRPKPLDRDAVLARSDAMATVLADVIKATLLDIDIGVSAYFDKLTSDAKASEDAAAAKINRAVTLTGAVLKDVAAGELRSRIEEAFEPEFQQIKDDTNAVVEQLATIVAQLQTTSRSLKTATGEILAGANDLSDRTTRQAATIEQTTAAVDQLSSAVMDNAKRATTASGKALAVSRSATEGGAVMQEANGAMAAIETSSSKISNIIGLIDDIAFQTNLLALNASVEAARAGEAGKGFAVVAVEVRRLAQSAASASADVKLLIDASAHEVRSGARLVGQASDKLRDILAEAQESSTLIDSIAQANSAQASALSEVSIAVRQMDEMTQHNAALVEEINASIEQTEAQASELDGIVDVFKLDNRKSVPAARATQPRKTIAQLRTVGSSAVAKDWSQFRACLARILLPSRGSSPREGRWGWV
ncbi:methyl-accepting chemotaxis protein [Devosia sp. UYZn731]|uniref:methyl-accepting chemotaxis protein n=1 Tax=Devosia sp. UYZn731 TaxID=3156345 RepID=UPI003394FCF9